jgi:hypothetical protein
VSRVSGSGLALVLAALLAYPFGVMGVAWAGTVGTGTTSLIAIWKSGAIGRGHRDRSANHAAVSRTVSP